jgi:hypothetical protein
MSSSSPNLPIAKLRNQLDYTMFLQMDNSSLQPEGVAWLAQSTGAHAQMRQEAADLIAINRAQFGLPSCPKSASNWQSCACAPQPCTALRGCCGNPAPIGMLSGRNPYNMCFVHMRIGRSRSNSPPRPPTTTTAKEGLRKTSEKSFFGCHEKFKQVSWLCLFAILLHIC